MPFTRDDIVAAARTYLKPRPARWQHLARIAPTVINGRREGEVVRPGLVDCIGLLAGVCNCIGFAYEDRGDYSTHPDGHTIIEEFDRQLERLPSFDDSGVGSIFVCWMTDASRPQHCLIQTWVEGVGWCVIHTNAMLGFVAEHGWDDRWLSRRVACYDIPGVLPHWGVLPHRRDLL